MATESPTLTIEKTATPEKAPVVDKGTTKITTEKTGESEIKTSESTEPGTDTFTSIDAKTLTPELKVKYDAMLTDYKKKTTEVAQQRREAEAKYQEVQEVLNNPDFQRTYKSMTSSEKAQTREDIGVTEEEFNRAFENKENFSGFIQKIAKVSSAQDKQEITNLKASLAIKEFKQTHPEFDKLNKYQFITKQLQTDPRAHGSDEKLWNQALNDAYLNSERVYNEIVEEGKKQGLERIQEKVRASTEPPTDVPTQVNPFGDPKKWTTAQAIAAARQGYRVSSKD